MPEPELLGSDPVSLLVLLPCYNEETHLEKTLACLKGQTLKDFTCLVSDNHSTDRTWDILQDAAGSDDRFHIARHEENIGGQRNIASLVRRSRDHAAGRYAMIFAGHDLISDSYLERCVAFLERDTEKKYSMVGGRMHWMSPEDQPIKEIEDAYYEFYLKTGLDAFIESTIRLANCTILNSVVRKELLHDLDFESWPLMRSFDHIMISYFSSRGFIFLEENERYLRRVEASRPEGYLDRLAGKTDLGFPTMQRNFFDYYLRVFESRFPDMLAAERSYYSTRIFEVLGKRFGFPAYQG